MTDSYRQKGLRKKLANTVEEKGITDKRVIQVFRVESGEFVLVP